MPSQATVTTPLPTGVRREAIVAALHDHDNYISITCPDLIAYHKISGTPDIASPCICMNLTKGTPPLICHVKHTYIDQSLTEDRPSYLDEVIDKRPIGKTTLQLTLINTGDGIDATVHGKAPTGGAIVVVSKWRVHADRIEEDVAIDSNFVMNKMIKGNVEKNHPLQHLGFCQTAA